MKHIEEPAKSIPVMAETDVLVVGSGPGGLSAALAASRMGVKTMLVERFGCFGGNTTHSMQESVAWYRHEKTVDAGGIQHEFESRAMEMGAAQDDPRCLSVLLDGDMFRVVADKMVTEAGITPLLHCFAVDAIMEGDAIKGIITESKSGRQAILAKRVIDATGDADIISHAGAPYSKGGKDEIMPVTTNFGCSGVDVEKVKTYLEEHAVPVGKWARETSGKEDEIFTMHVSEPFDKAKAAGEIPKDVRMGGGFHTFTDAGEANDINVIRIRGIDTTDVWDLTKAEIEGRQHVIWAVAALKKYMPGFENAKLRTFGMSLGTRESRKIIGEYNMTEEDVKGEARFEDSIGICPEFLDAYGVVIVPTTGRYFQFPYGGILPQKVENLLVAGRCVGGDRISHAATRQVVCCCVTGQGAGIAAAQSIKDDVLCREVSISKVQKNLEGQGVRIK